MDIFSNKSIDSISSNSKTKEVGVSKISKSLTIGNDGEESNKYDDDVDVVEVKKLLLLIWEDKAEPFKQAAAWDKTSRTIESPRSFPRETRSQNLCFEITFKAQYLKKMKIKLLLLLLLLLLFQICKLKF